jgi:hypothetical protein
MPINTREKRQSIAGLRKRPVMLPGVGALDIGDRMQMAGVYRGFGAGPPPTSSTDLIVHPEIPTHLRSYVLE